ncbi:MAG TPA: hypothetical protein VGV93_05780 [Acidimicrobiales bacterium]|nr:hypothetical protein [Acidimicrobiales bacterium]
MTDPVADASRAAAQRLAEEYGPSLAGDVEEALYLRGESRSPERYLDPVSLGGLIVSVATLAWTVFNDLRTKAAKPSADVVARRVRVRLETDDSVTPAARNHIIDVVVSETIVAAGPGIGEE